MFFIISFLYLNLLILFISYIIYEIKTIENNTEFNIGKLDIEEYYVLTVYLNQIKTQHHNELISFFQENSYINKLSYGILKLNNTFPEFESYREDYNNNVNIYGKQLFSLNIPKYKYIPIKHNNITYFTTFSQLNYINWIITSGLYDEIIENKDLLLQKVCNLKIKTE